MVILFILKLLRCHDKLIYLCVSTGILANGERLTLTTDNFPTYDIWGKR